MNTIQRLEAVAKFHGYGREIIGNLHEHLDNIDRYAAITTRDYSRQTWRLEPGQYVGDRLRRHEYNRIARENARNYVPATGNYTFWLGAG